MRNLTSISISFKLPAIITAIGLCACLAVASLNFIDFRTSTLEQAKRSFDILKSERGVLLETWLQNVGGDVVTQARRITVVNAVLGLGSSFKLNGDTAALKAAYVTNNPFPAGQRDQLDQATEMTTYNFQHGAFHNDFRLIAVAGDYSDVLLISLEGDVIYSYAKNADFGTNVATQTNNNLTDVFLAARGAAPGTLSYADYAPYPATDNSAAAFVATPVFTTDGAVAGVIAVKLSISPIDMILNRPAGLGDTGLIYVVGDDGLTRNSGRLIGGHVPLQNVSHLEQATSPLSAGTAFFLDVSGISGMPAIADAAEITVLGSTWRIIGEMQTTEVMKPVNVMRNKLIIVCSVVMGIAALLGLWTARSVVRPLDRLRVAMDQVSDRNYDTEISDISRGDELGQLSRVLVGFRDKLRASDRAEQERQIVLADQARVVEQLSQAMVILADGDLTAMINGPFSEHYEKLREDYNRIVTNLNATVRSVVTSAVGIRERAQEMSSASDDLARRTENQAATLEQTAAAMDELTSSVRSAANGAREVEVIVANARQDADASEPVVHQAVAAMTAIERSSGEISQIVGVIDDIAFQTNLLALNAGVEAARAGDAGRGFAVVASEVRALAQRSSEAAKQIKALIAGSSDQVATGVSLVGQAGDALTKIAKHISHISGLVSEIAAGAAEQSTGLAEINIGVTQLDQVTQQNAAMVEQATASSHALNAEAGSLGDLVARFRLDQNRPRSSHGTPRPADNVMMFQTHPTRDRPAVGALMQPVAMTGTTGRAASVNSDGWEDF